MHKDHELSQSSYTQTRNNYQNSKHAQDKSGVGGALLGGVAVTGNIHDSGNSNNSTKYYTTTFQHVGEDEHGNKRTETRIIETSHYKNENEYGCHCHLDLSQESVDRKNKVVPVKEKRYSDIIETSARVRAASFLLSPDRGWSSKNGSLEKEKLLYSHHPFVRRTFCNICKLKKSSSKMSSNLSGQAGNDKIYATGGKFKQIDKDGREIPRKPGQSPVQDYDKIKVECLKQKILFDDDQFPADDSSLFYSEAGKIPNVVWKRPGELSSNPKFFIDGFSRFDVNQGELGNCWFLAAVANLTLHDNIFTQVVPKDNSFVKDYTGAFHFRFWHYGCWVDIVVDDRLPCRAGTTQLIFMHSADKDEFWSALLEKAYAKLYGSYQALTGGTATEALQDFTGGLIETISIKDTKLDIFALMEVAQERQSFMGCSLKAINPNIIEGKTSEGLVRGHAYSITKVQRVDISTPNKSGKIPLVRIRNPWGNEFEWKGAWSDGSREWNFVPETIKQTLDLSFSADGEFWMSLKDFKEHFDTLEICYLGPDSLVSIPNTIHTTSANKVELEVKHEWNTNVFEGRWTSGATSGGCVNYIANDPKTFAHNPQYIVNVGHPEAGAQSDKSMVLIALMQKGRRTRKKEGATPLSIGFTVYQLKDPENTPNPLDLNFFRYHLMIGDSGDFINAREVSGRFELGLGSYCIVPSTFHPNQDGEFMIRIFSGQSNQMKENNGDVGFGKLDKAVVKKSDEQERETFDAIHKLFTIMAGEDLEIGWTKLKLLLDSYLKKEFNLSGLSREVCRSMVAMFDADRTGKLGVEEFTALWKNILTWMSCFKIYDVDNSGNLNSLELRAALGSIGYHVNNTVLAAIVLRYGDESGNISLEDFIMVAVKLKSLIESYKERDTVGTNQVCFKLEEWVEKSIYS